MNHFQQRWTCLFVLLACLVGCGEPKLVRYPISGKVTYQGKPVPAGEIKFVPDNERSNFGPATYMMIVDGDYASMEGYGILGGAYIIEITGNEKKDEEIEVNGMIMVESGKPLFSPYTTTHEFERAEQVHDFEVP